MRYRTIGKRMFDLLVCLVALPIVLPVCVVVSLLLVLTQGFPVFYLAPRPGRAGKLFRPLKFRTMRKLRAGENPHGAQRLTGIGKIIRNSSLDELPQLWNVLVGQMSIVGPRPLLPVYLPLYNERQALRHAVKPGLTGLVQIKGRNAIGWIARFELDAQYVENCSFGLDISILYHTVRLLISGRLGKSEGVAPSEPFRGNFDASHP